MNPLSSVATGIRKDRETTVRYEVQREREPGQMGIDRPPLIEEFHGLDRARVAALGYALDGPTSTGARFTGVVRIEMVLSGTREGLRRTLIDVIDERVASRVLNEVRLPKADELSISLDQLQSELTSLQP